MSENKFRDDRSETLIKSGKDVLPYLAQTYQQLYLKPGEEGALLYPGIVQKGQDAPERDLSHFRMNEKDCLEWVDTPAGKVQVLTLHERVDFELFLQIMTNKCVPYEVPATQGASILDGLINWQKIREHKEDWMKGQLLGGKALLEWPEEFRRFTSERKNYKDVLILLSVGPYSNIKAEAFGLDGQVWLDRSYTIRKYHECTHFICRRIFPEKIDAVWDEIVADAVSIVAAFGRFDPAMEEVFFGINESGYIGGRLENYVEDKDALDALAARIHSVIARVAGLYETGRKAGQITDPFDLAIMLEEKQEEWWQA